MHYDRIKAIRTVETVHHSLFLVAPGGLEICELKKNTFNTQCFSTKLTGVSLLQTGQHILISGKMLSYKRKINQSVATGG